MRKIFLTFVLAFIGNALLANHGNSRAAYNSDLNIKMWDNSSFTIILDNRSAERTRNFSLKNVAPGDHFIKIIKRKKNHHGYGGFVQTIYKGHINVPAKRKVFVKVEGRNRLSFKFFKKSNHHRNHHNNGNNHGGHYGSNNYNNGWSSGCESVNSDYGHYGESHFGDNDFDNHHGPVVISDSSFDQLIRIMEREHFDDDRLGIALQAVGSNSLSVNQVSIIMDQFTFDNSKLDFAKAAYRKTIDRENYFVVNSKFAFSSSVSDLNNYIRHNA